MVITRYGLYVICPISRFLCRGVSRQLVFTFPDRSDIAVVVLIAAQVPSGRPRYFVHSGSSSSCVFLMICAIRQFVRGRGKMTRNIIPAGRRRNGEPTLTETISSTFSWTSVYARPRLNTTATRQRVAPEAACSVVVSHALRMSVLTITRWRALPPCNDSVVVSLMLRILCRSCGGERLLLPKVLSSCSRRGGYDSWLGYWRSGEGLSYLWCGRYWP
jgi:hypothetical protein